MLNLECCVLVTELYSMLVSHLHFFFFFFILPALCFDSLSVRMALDLSKNNFEEFLKDLLTSRTGRTNSALQRKNPGLIS